MLVIIICLILFYYGNAIKMKNSEPTYRISMVSSPDNPGRPALFSHAESPLWDPDTQNFYFVDVHQQNVHQLDYNSGKIYTKHICYGQTNVISLVADSRRLLVTVRSGVYLLDLWAPGDGALRHITSMDMGMPDNVINEGKPDAYGRFWAGTKGPQTGDDVAPDKATFYVMEPGCSEPRPVVRPVSISNGLAFSHNNTRLYYIDSPKQTIDVFDYDLQKGEISGRRTIFDITKYGYVDEIPDGMTIDSDGHLWVAIMFGAAVLHINPDTGDLINEYKLPTSRVTAVAWGGPHLDELFVTTGQDTLKDKQDPLAGAIFTIRGTGSSGVAPHMVKFENADSY